MVYTLAMQSGSMTHFASRISAGQHFSISAKEEADVLTY